MVKIFLKCRSLLLKKALEIFFNNNLAEYKNCDVVISDHTVKTKKPIIIIGKDIKKPFSKKTIQNKIREILKDKYKNNVEEQIEKATKEFATKLFEILKNSGQNN